MNGLQHGNAYQVHERLPIAVDAITADGAKLQGTESRRSKQLHGIKHCQHRFRVLHGEIAVLEAEQDAKRLVRRGNFYFLAGRKRLWHLSLQKEVQAAILREFFLAAKPHCRGRRRIQLDVLGKKVDGWALRIDLTV